MPRIDITKLSMQAPDDEIGPETALPREGREKKKDDDDIN
jgi:hypothetical protein